MLFVTTWSVKIGINDPTGSLTDHRFNFCKDQIYPRKGIFRGKNSYQHYFFLRIISGRFCYRLNSPMEIIAERYCVMDPGQ